MVRVDDAAGTAGTEVDYENTADEVWAQRALDSYQHRQLQVAAFDTEGVVSAQIWGTCPRCGHDLNIQMTLSAPVVTWRGGWSSVGRRNASGIPDDVEVGCGCGLIHTGAPEHVTGCGVSFHLPTEPPAP
jgi:hypothetical protein